MPEKRLAGKRLDRRHGGLAFMNQAQLMLINLGLHPDRVQVDHLEHRVAFRHLLALDDVFLEDVPALGRKDREREVGLSLREDLIDLGLGDSPPLAAFRPMRGPSHADRSRASDRSRSVARSPAAARRDAFNSSWIACDNSGL